MDLLEIWATWIFDRYERVKGQSPKNFFSGLWALVWSENATAEGSDLFLER